MHDIHLTVVDAGTVREVVLRTPRPPELPAVVGGVLVERLAWAEVAGTNAGRAADLVVAKPVFVCLAEWWEACAAEGVLVLDEPEPMGCQVVAPEKQAAYRARRRAGA